MPTPPVTWDDMIRQAEDLARRGKPHHIAIQGAAYEGYTVWINAMILSAGGQILSDDGRRVIIGPQASRAVFLIRRLARSPAADPSLSVQMEDQARLAFESGDAAFEIKYPFVYPSALQNKPELAAKIGWVEYPRVDAGTPSRPPVGGIDLAVVEALGGLLGLLRQADQHDRAEVYARIGLQMQYRPGTGTVLAEIRSKDIDRVPVMCPEPNKRDIHTVVVSRELTLAASDPIASEG